MAATSQDETLKEEVNEPIKAYNTNEAQSFTQEQLTTSWVKYAKLNHTDNPRLHSIFTSLSPVLKDNFVVELSLNNELQLEEIDKIKFPIMNFLRKDLSNGKIELVTLLAEVMHVSKRIFSEKEKFDFMVQKNPTLMKFRQAFGLDFG